MIKWLINEIKKDVKFLKDLSSGKIQKDINWKQIRSQLFSTAFLKENLTLFLVIGFAFSCGVLLAANYYEHQCYLIIENITTGLYAPIDFNVSPI